MGLISVIKKYKGEITRVSGWVRTLAHVCRQVDFLTNPMNRELNRYIEDYYSDTSDTDITIEEYGVLIIDYDSKVIYNNNLYSHSYMHVPFISQSHDKIIPYITLFNNSLLCIKEVININNIEQTKITNLSDISDFHSLDDAFNWLAEYDHEELGEGNFITRSLYIDLWKLGWELYNYDSDQLGYLELYNKLLENGYNISDRDIRQWSDTIIGIGDQPTLYTLVTTQRRDSIIDSILKKNNRPNQFD